MRLRGPGPCSQGQSFRYRHRASTGASRTSRMVPLLTDSLLLYQDDTVPVDASGMPSALVLLFITQSGRIR
jgi:hypothetical protein